ncbi:porin family protein [Rhodohalobacter mucosus]|uniref:Outer membrane protein beta-barrel domain-containing protein n=1 Tax=Rhodohalobacter mucosus TaxID=2079485 RepID=A0A316U340_9BACT|nr:porin family protein [Rhodohalobacter mucosus]PWN07786.1 hypothetical protein DDZ15_01880 [Rhodohalobacter mucosus]
MHFLSKLFLPAIIFLLGSSFFAPFSASAQNLGLGAKVGINVTSHLNNFRFVSGDIDLDFNPGVATGFTGGLIIRRPISRNFRFQAEPTFSMMGATYNDDFVLRGFDFDSDSRTKLYYVQLPLIIQFSTAPPERVVFGRERAETTYHLSGGLFGGYLFDATFSGTNTGAPIGIAFEGAFSENVTDQYKEYDGGVILGGGIEYGSTNKIGLDLRILYSVLDSGDFANVNFKPHNIGLSIVLYYLL